MKHLLILLACATIIAGCGGNSSDRSEENNPSIKKGLELAKDKQWDQAVDQFIAAYEKDPKLARPHLELALIYHQHKKDYVRAIFHYEEYLKKQPKSEKRELILRWIGQARISLAAEIGSNEKGISEELVRLTRENNILRSQLESSGQSVRKVANVKTIVSSPAKKRKTTSTISEPIKKNLTQTMTPTSYTVQPGDTLTRISKNVYGTGSYWKNIYQANHSEMQNENDLKVGQVLIIPMLDL